MFRTTMALAIALVVAAPGIATADGARIVRGGPATASAKAKLVLALDAARADAAVCWRRGRRGPVQVELAVSAKGAVTKSAQVTRGATAQCVAGILAVHALVPARGGYRVTVELGPGGGTADRIQAGLAALRERLDRCYQRAAERSPGLKGEVTLAFTVHPDGRLTKPVVASSTLASPAAERCLVGVIRGARIGEGRVRAPIGYSLALAFSGGGKPRGRAPVRGLQPKKDGPLAAEAITAVMDRRRGAFSKCYDKHARKRRDLAGRVVLRFTIRDDGTVRNVKIRETTLRHDGVERCMVRVGQKLRFPAEPGRGPTRVHYPFAFSQK